MSRSTFTFRHQLSAEHAEEIAARFLSENGLKFMTLKTGERVWKRGTGLFIDAQFLSLYHSWGKTTVMAWIQTGMGLMARSEQDLYGISAIIPKKQITRLLGRLEEQFLAAGPDALPEPEDEEEPEGDSGYEDDDEENGEEIEEDDPEEEEESE